MADDGSAQSKTIWPLPQFNFRVTWGSNVMSFQEASGLEIETQQIDYRHGGGIFSTVKMPGVKKFGNVTLKKGVLKPDDNFWDWHSQIRRGTVKTAAVTIELLDQNGTATLAWTLTNAWPTKVSATDLKSEGDEVDVESIEFAHEGLTVASLS